MKTSSSNYPNPSSSPAGAGVGAFTLIELMVVMVIVGILAGIAIPTFSKIIAGGKRKVALSDALQLKNSIGSYFTEYRKYPIRQPGADDGNNPDFSDHPLMDVLLASDRETGPGGLNTRRLRFCEFPDARPMGGGKFRSGVIGDAYGGGELWDSYGNYYRVVMDTDFDNRIPAPDFAVRKTISHDVIVWSAGPDGEDATVEDNVMTWRP